MTPQMTPQEFANKIKAKYPQYQSVDDAVLVEKMLVKFPEYKSQIIQPQPVKPQEKTLAEKAGGALDTVFGGGKIGEAIGTQIAKGTFGDTVQKIVTGRDLTPEEEALVGKGPTAGQIAGDVARVGATFVPNGKIAGATSKFLGGGRLARLSGQMLAGGTAGAAADIGLSMSEGQAPQLGAGTIVGAGIPLVSPVLGGLTRTAGKIGAEIEGALTGTSAETIEQAFNAARKGGDEAARFTEAMRGQITPEQVALGLRENVARVASERSQAYANSIKEIGENIVKTNAAKTTFADKLKEVGIKITDKGLDFSNSKLDLVPAAQSKIVTAFNKISGLSDNIKLGDLDNARQAIKALELAGDDPSANLANKLIDDAVRAVRKSGESVTGYSNMLDDFGEQSEFLNQLQRDLMAGDRATLDQTFRRMVTSLRTNNEQRAALVKELDEATGGAILSTVAGQQLSETLPRGIFRQIAAGMAGGAALTGSLSPALLPTLVIASPRVAGEFVRTLGIGAQKADAVIEALSVAREMLVKAGAITASVNDVRDE